MFYLSFKDLWDNSFPQDTDDLKSMFGTEETIHSLLSLPEITNHISDFFTASEYRVASMLGVFPMGQSNARGLPIIQRNLEFVKEGFQKAKTN